MAIHQKISCIILTCDSHKNKGNSVFHCLWSVCNQDYENIEIVLVENSHQKPRYLQKFEEKFNKWSNKVKNRTFKIISNKKSFSRSRARNIGLSHTSGEIIVFLDDDTVILDFFAFSYIAKFSKLYDYGYGAKRLWTKNDLFQKKSKDILTDLEAGNTESLMKISRKSLLTDRKDNLSLVVLSKTFIANFGFCKKNLIDKIGGFSDFLDYGYEDDYLMFKLFLSNNKLLLLDKLTVVHVNHKIGKIKERNIV